jgi:hypothetical protein
MVKPERFPSILYHKDRLIDLKTKKINNPEIESTLWSK